MPHHPKSPPVFPYPWASSWGEDEYGLWMGLDYNGVQVVFRWIEPGTFMMGSPDNEKERYSWEDCHQVTLSEGYWLTETSVTQTLWEAVMGSNPSHFKGENLPVETVSWDDCQNFLKKMSEFHIELALRLPWEAEWEYACRAGTTTPFSFGENITPEQVNYDGNYPYSNGIKGEFRSKTVPVKALPCNSWGLYEMHGNVWEWCQDQWQSSLGQEAAKDPRHEGSEPEEGAERVIRGGSWDNLGGSARSACRGSGSPGNRVDGIGLRLSLGQPSGSSRGGSR